MGSKNLLQRGTAWGGVIDVRSWKDILGLCPQEITYELGLPPAGHLYTLLRSWRSEKLQHVVRFGCRKHGILKASFRRLGSDMDCETVAGISRHTLNVLRHDSYAFVGQRTEIDGVDRSATIPRDR